MADRCEKRTDFDRWMMQINAPPIIRRPTYRQPAAVGQERTSEDEAEGRQFMNFLQAVTGGEE